MSIDHGLYGQQGSSELPVFLSVDPGLTVIVKHDFQTGEKRDKDWWMGRVINYRGAAYDTSIDNPEQIADGDSVVIRWSNADPVVHIISMASGSTNLAIEVCLVFVLSGARQRPLNASCFPLSGLPWLLSLASIASGFPGGYSACPGALVCLFPTDRSVHGC